MATGAGSATGAATGAGACHAGAVNSGSGVLAGSGCGSGNFTGSGAGAGSGTTGAAHAGATNSGSGAGVMTGGSVSAGADSATGAGAGVCHAGAVNSGSGVLAGSGCGSGNFTGSAAGSGRVAAGLMKLSSKTRPEVDAETVGSVLNAEVAAAAKALVSTTRGVTGSGKTASPKGFAAGVLGAAAAGFEVACGSVMAVAAPSGVFSEFAREGRTRRSAMFFGSLPRVCAPC